MIKLKNIFLASVFTLSAFALAWGDIATKQISRRQLSLETPWKIRAESRAFVTMLEQAHYIKTHIDELDMREFVREYMQNVDVFKLFFTANDVQYFQDFFARSIDITLRQGSVSAAYSIYDKFLDRADERLKWIKNRISKPFDFSQNDTFRPDRSKENWPLNEAQADELWEKRLKFDIINQILGFDAEEDSLSEDENQDPLDATLPAKKKQEATSEKKAQIQKMEKDSPKTFAEKLEKARKEVLERYERIVSNYAKSDKIEIQEIYLNTLAHFYDPHTSFHSEYMAEEFEIAIRNALIGIGAVLQEKDGYCIVKELMVGGPAEECGLIKPEDKIVGVGQGKDGKIVDTVGMKLRKIVHMIRGGKGSTVRLLIQSGSNPAQQRVVVLVRREIKLTTKLAKAEIFTVPLGNKTVPVGVIDLPAFYSDSDSGKNGSSTTRDVEELLTKLKARGVQGIILDLRRNGGGFLSEAVSLSGLFIKTGPVVQVSDPNSNVKKLRDEDEKVVWDGPLMILVSRLSASATEIVAGALQNHQRAIIVGDKATHGKGTVQGLYPLSLLCSGFKPISKAKLTVQKWYAPNGDSIQLKGVHSDIVLPSVYDYMEIGEEYQDYALKWDKILPDTIDTFYGYGFTKPQSKELISLLTKQSQERRNSLEEFKLWNERIERFKKFQDKKDWSLNLAEREKELKESEDFADRMKAKQKEMAKGNFKKEEILLDVAIAELEKEKAAEEAKKKEENAKAEISSENSGENLKQEDSPKVAKVKSKKATEKKSKSGSSLSDDDDAPEFDILLREGLRIMADVIQLKENPEPLTKAAEESAKMQQAATAVKSN